MTDRGCPPLRWSSAILGTTPELWYAADEILLINFHKLEIPQITPSKSDSSFKSIKTKLHKNKRWYLILVSTFLLNIFLILCNWNSLTFSRRICHNSGIVRGSWHGCAAPSKFPPLFFFYRRHPSLLSLLSPLRILLNILGSSGDPSNRCHDWGPENRAALPITRSRTYPAHPENCHISEGFWLSPNLACKHWL